MLKATKKFITSVVSSDKKKNMSAGEFKSDDPAEFARAECLGRLFGHHVHIPDRVLSNVFDFEIEQVNALRKQYVRKATLDKADEPLTWDYVFCFLCGDDEPDNFRKPSNNEKDLREGIDAGHKEDNPDFNSTMHDEEWENGVAQQKYFGQIFFEMWQDLEKARLSVKAFKSENEKYMFLVVGLTERNLKLWADDRDTDLLLDPTNACLEGRRKHFKLALRTIMHADEREVEDVASDDDDGTSKPHKAEQPTLPLSNWSSMYAQYNPRANPDIYKKYPRIPGKEEPMTIFDERTRLRIIYEAIVADKGEGGAEIEITDHLLSKKHPLMAVFPLHNPVELEEFEQEWLRSKGCRDLFTAPLDKIRNYFGEPVGFYYAFLLFYLNTLMIPAGIGFIFFLVQIITGEVDCPGIWIMAIVIIFWCVAVVDLWLRREAAYRQEWGMTKFEAKAVARPQFQGSWQHDEVSGQWTEHFSFVMRGLRTGVILTGVAIFMAGCVAAVIQVLMLKDTDPTDTGLKIGLGVANGVMIFVFDITYKFMSQSGNEWENHRTEQDFQDALISKSFIFRFFNAFSTLFYLAFVRPFWKGEGYYIKYYDGVCSSCSEDILNDNETSDCMTGSYDDWNDDDYECCITETFCSGEICCGSIDVQNEINEAALGELQLQLLTLFLTAIVVQNCVEVLIPKIVEWVKTRDLDPNYTPSEPEVQMNLVPVENTIDDVSEIVVQFGYVTLFVMALPLMPLLAIVNNVAELRVDGFNYVKSQQRPSPNGSSGLGAWNDVLAFFSIISVATNVGLLTWRTKVVTDLFDENSEYKWIFFSVVSVGLALMVSFEKWAIPDVPIEIVHAGARQDLIESVLVLGATPDHDDVDQPLATEDDFKFDPSLEFISPDTLDVIPQENLAVHHAGA